ncbi:hypothetical protein [Pseudomonas matsuisoli]|uniref:Uncharacterized protein n=1 Tax=Pseudomonas matsuisoli TaxID=1515666 RepID=A0A917Q3E3_9PSED|nr:hypothetical protein [Pseudomonas matsuisoli]GGK06710.1 hypothetical protein GCM10009304_36150 [Pseudomonas matsuisoli]
MPPVLCYRFHLRARRPVELERQLKRLAMRHRDVIGVTFHYRPMPEQRDQWQLQLMFRASTPREMRASLLETVTRELLLDGCLRELDMRVYACIEQVCRPEQVDSMLQTFHKRSVSCMQHDV